ncbi:MAG: IPT/TIG domain-containing protein, partial [Bryobacteraceae bacterium]
TTAPPANYGRYPVLSPSVSIVKAMASGAPLPSSMGDSEMSAFVDDAATNPAQYIYAVYNYKGGTGVLTDPNAPNNGVMIARAQLNGGTAPLSFLKWNGQGFGAAGMGGYDTPVFPSGSFSNCAGPGQISYGASISYVDVTQQYLLTFVCDSPGDPALGQVAGAPRGGAWFYSTSYSLSNPGQWTPPQEITGSWAPFDQSGGCSSYKGFYPTLMSLGAKTGHLSTSGYVFYLYGCQTDNTPPPGRLYSSRSFTITLSSTPAISSLSPTSATAGTAAFTLTVNGTGFVSGDTVTWGMVTGQISLATTYVNPTTLTAQVPASLLATSRTVQITVSSPSGVQSNASTFTVTPAAAGPAIASVSPSFVKAGSPPVNVTIVGTGFAGGIVALWNGVSLVTNYVNSTTLAAQIPADDLVNQGTVQFTVANPSGPASNSFPFVITSPSPLQLLTVAPCRVMDTRNPNGTFGGPFIATGTSRTIPIPSSACGVPANAAAYSLNFTVVPRTGTLGSLTVWPTGQPQPLVSTLTSPDGSVLASAALVPAGTASSINAYATDDTDLVVDINGYFVPPTAGTLQFYPLPPCRVLDTRNANGTFGGPSLPAGGNGRSFPFPSSSCGAPASAAAYSLNVTVVPQGSLGYLTAWPTGQTQPFVSTMNSYDGTVIANAAIVPAGTGGAVSFYATNTTDLVVDINGYFAPPGSAGLNFYTVTPCRLVDTRNANGTFGGPAMGAATTRSFPLPQASCGLPAYPAAQAYSLSMTVIPQGVLGYLSTWPTGGTQPFVSTLNAWKGRAVANAALVPAGTGSSINVFVTNTTDLTIDTAGYFGP